jgi:hypothetical protein
MANDIQNIIQYNSRTYSQIKNDLLSFIQSSYPELLSDFSDSSVGDMLISINAAVSNNLANNTDRAFNETQLANTQQINNLRNIAKTLGFNLPSRKGSVTLVDVSVSLPVLGDSPDFTYSPLLSAGAQFVGGGKIFETLDDVDFNSPVSNLGDPNRSILPNLDSNGLITSYLITKRIVVQNGNSNVFKRIISATDIVPFLQIT